MSKHYVGTTGTEILLNTGSDISGATVTEMLVKKPSGATVTWTATILTGDPDLPDNVYLKYVVQAGDWDEEGEWEIQADVELPSWSGPGDPAIFVLYKKIA